MYQPDPGPEADVLRLVNAVPKAFFHLAAIAERTYADLGVGGPERGVLRDLFLDGAQTVPDLARKRHVSRQAIQQVVAQLLAKALIEFERNPRHKRSQLFVLTKKGLDLCVTLQERDLAEIRRIMRRTGLDDAATAAAVLEQLNAALAEELAEASSSSPT